MPKVSRPRIAGPDYDDDRDEAPPPRARSSARSNVRAKDVPYSVAWFRDRVATYALGTIICGAIMLTLAMWMGGSLGAFGQRMNNGFNVIAQWAGISVKDVSVCAMPQAGENAPAHGCKKVDPALEARILAQADVQVGQSIVSADPFAVRARVEKVEAVGEGGASVRRLWPDTIKIDVEQRQAVALFQKTEGGEWKVVDQSGRAFAEADPSKYVNLPHVIGDGADHAAAMLMSAISQFPDIASRFESAHRVDGRRWDLRFRNGADATLPPDDRLVEALASINLRNAQVGLLNQAVAHIDARNPAQLAIRPIAGSPSPLPGGI